MKHVKKVLKFLGKYYNTFVGTIIFLIVLVVAWLTFWPFVPAKINAVHIQGTVRAGGQISYTTDFCRYVGQGTKIERDRFLVPEDPTLTSPVELSTSPTRETVDDFIGCKTSDNPIRLPVEVGTPAGEYRLLIRLCYYVAPWRCVPVEAKSEPFKVERLSVEDELAVLNQRLEFISDLYDVEDVSNEPVGQAPLANAAPAPQAVTPPAPTAPTETPVEPRVIPEEQEDGLIQARLKETQKTVDNLLTLLVPRS